MIHEPLIRGIWIEVLKANLEKVENAQAVLSIEVDAPRVQNALDRAYRSIAQRVDIPGFRKGRAPRALVKQYVGWRTVWKEALDEIITETFDEAVHQTGIEPVDDPHIEVLHMGEGEPLSYRATVTVKPEVDLGDYRSISIAKEKREVTPEDVDFSIESLRERMSYLEVMEDTPAALGLFVSLSYSLHGDGVSRTQEEPQLVEIGKGQLPEVMEAPVIGLKAGEEVRTKISFPSDFPDMDLAGKECEYWVKVFEVKKKVMPELNDEFVSSLGEYANVEEFRQAVTNKLERIFDAKAEEALADKVIAEVVRRARVEIPEVMITRQQQSMIQDWLFRLEQMKVPFEAYLYNQGLTVDQFKEKIREQAEARVKVELVLEAIAKAEGIGAQANEVDEVLNKGKMPVNMAGYVWHSLIMNKTVKFLKELAQKNAAAGAGAAQAGDDA